MAELIHDVVQANIYRRTPSGDIEFLILKRVPADGGFWQPMTGHTDPSENHEQALRRELQEEANLSEFVAVSDKLAEYFYDLRGESGRDSVYAVEVPHDSVVRLNPDEHEAYHWLQLEEALTYLKYDANKEAMQRVHQYATSA